MNKTEALNILNSHRKGIPFSAIEFLYELPYDADLEKKIMFHLENAYNDRASMMLDHDLANTALWYAILAEKHATPQAIPSLINLFATPDTPDWDFLDEQGLFLVGLLSDKYPETVNLFLDAIENQIEKKSNAPYLYLYDCVYGANDQQHGDRIAALLKNPDTGWKELLAVHVAEAKLTSCRKEVENILESFKQYTEPGTNNYQIRVELEYALEIFDDPAKSGAPFFKQRAPWKQHYQQMEHFFTDENPMLSTVYNNIGRNDLCPCGSGKKFKNCCGKN